MNRTRFSDPLLHERGSGRFLWRVLAVAILFFVVGLGAIWGYFSLIDRTPVGLETLDPNPAILADVNEDETRIQLFFTEDGVRLSPELREIEATDSLYDRARAILAALFEGPRSRKLVSPIPDGVTLRNLYITEDTVVLDFSKELRDGLSSPPSAEALCVYSIVNSLIQNCPELKTVQLLVEGRPVENVPGALDLSAPLVANLALIRP